MTLRKSVTAPSRVAPSCCERAGPMTLRKYRRAGPMTLRTGNFRPTAEREADEIAEKVARLLTTGQALGILLDRLSDRTQGGPETDAKPDAGDEAKTE